MATIIDVARRAGVSVSTVSHVVNGTRAVRDDTRQRVREAILEIGYTPDPVARALRRSKTEAIGLVVTDTGQPGFAEMIRGVELEARAKGFTLLLANSNEDRDLELASIEGLLGRRVDGLLLAQVAGSPHSVVESVKARNVPIVLLDRLSSPDVDQVGVEAAEPMRLLVQHLIAVGHRRIGLLAGDDRIPTLRERRLGYAEAIAAAGLPETVEVIVTEVSKIPAAAHDAVIKLCSAPEGPTALVAASHLLAVGGMQGLETLKLRIPSDVAFVVFDEFPYADLFEPRLTSVAQPNVQAGREATRLLMRRMRYPNAPVRTVRLKPRIVHRDSCGCAPGTPFLTSSLVGPTSLVDA
jgi:LacI family transcriptional regulator